MHAWNASAIITYAEEGTSHVQAEDGDQDEMCAARNGRIFTLEEAMAEDELEHPNGTLSWSPVTTEEDLAQLRQDVIDMGWGG